MFTRHQAAVQAEQMHRMDETERKERNINRSIRGESNEQHCGDTSDEEIITECDEQFISGSEPEHLDTTQGVFSPKVLVQIPKTADTCSGSGASPITATSVNKKYRSYTKNKTQSTKAQRRLLPQTQTEGDLSDKEGEPIHVDQNNTYMLNSLGQLINGALNKMTVAIGKIFRTTVQEMNQNKDNKVSEIQTQQSRRTGVKQRRRRLPSPATDSKIDSESDSDEELTKTSGSSVSTRSIFHSRSRTNSVKLPAFRGESDEKWKAYINRFEAVAKLNNWTEEDKLAQLLPRLQGPAGEFVYEELRPEVLSNYKRLVKELQSRFGIIESSRTYQTKFRRRDQKNGEHAQEYAAELKRLYSKAYPKRDTLTKQEDLVSRFLLGLTSEKARVHVELNRDPHTIEEAAEYVIEFEEATRYPRAEEEQQFRDKRRAYQCLDCEEPMMKYIGERRQVIAHLYKYHVPLDQVPYYCSLCHFLTAEKDKLMSHVKGYTKHVEAAKTLEKSGVPLENFLRANSNPVHLTEGVHFIRLSREESRQHWLKGITSRTSSTGTRPLLSPDPTPKIAAPAPAPAAELPEAALAPKSFTFDDLLDEDFSFLDPYLAGTSVSSVVEPQAPHVDQLKDQQVEIERTVTSRTEKATPEVEKELENEVTQRAPTKKVQSAKRKRRESSGSEDSNTSSSSDEESSSESEGERGKEGRKEVESRDDILTELRRTNQHLAKICTCLQEINSNIQGQGATLAKMVGSFSKDTTSPDPRKEEVESRKGVESRKEVESRREVESREEESRRKEGRENMPAREERNAEEFRNRQRREEDDYARGYHQWQPRRSPRKNKWFSWRR